MIWEAYRYANQPAGVFRIMLGLDGFQFTCSRPRPGKIRSKNDHDPRAVSALRILSGLYSMMKDRVISDASYESYKLPRFLEAVSMDVSGNHHLNYLFKFFVCSFPSQTITVLV